MEKKMIVFIINPVSGNGKGLKVWNQIKVECEQAGMAFRSFFTKHQGHAEEIARQVAELHQDRVDSIIVVGGDGTVHEVVNGLASYPNVPLGYIPGGSGNDFARGFSLPSTPKRALQDLLRRPQRMRKRYDSGRYSLGERKKTRRFVNGVGIGFDGEVAKATNTANYKKWLNKTRLGGLAYAVSALRLLFSYQPSHVVVEVDGEEKRFEDVWLVAVANIPYYGGGIKISPTAKNDDGKLNLCIVHRLKRWKLLPLFGAAFFGHHHRFKEVTLLEGKRFRIVSDRPLTIHADGETIGQTPIHVEVHEKGQLMY